MKRLALLLLGFGLVFAVPAWAQVQWDVGGFELTPPNTESLGLADDRQRETKDAVRSRTEVEHCFGTGGLAGASCDGVASPGSNFQDNGRHREGSARSFLDNTAPPNLEVVDYDYTGAAGTDVLDDGRTWFDQNDHNRAWVYDAAWELVTADDEVLAGAYNLMYNGSFEAAFGDGDPAGACAAVGACVTADLADTGWDVLLSPGITFVDPSADVLYGDGYSIAVQAVGAGLEGIIQTMNDLPAGAIYKLIFRNDGDGVDDCQVTAVGSVSGGLYDSGNLNNAAWATTEGEFTAGALEDVVISLISVNAGDICNWDNVVVYRIDDPEDDRPEITLPGVIALTDTTEHPADNQNYPAGWGNVAGIADFTITPAAGNYTIMVTAHGSAALLLNNENCYMRITEDVDGAGAAMVAQGSTGTLWTHTNDVSISLHYTRPFAVSGSTYVYELEIQDGALTAGTCTLAGDEHQHAFSVVAIPTR